MLSLPIWPAWVDVRSFAPPETPRDGLHAWDVYIQNAVNAIINASINDPSPDAISTLYLPSGQYRLDNPIQIQQVVDSKYGFCSIQITGDAPPYDRSFHGSVLIANFKDKPAIAIQCARAVTLRNLSIAGQNLWDSGKDVVKIILGDHDSDYLALGIKDDSPHAPYAGICIDPYCSPKPADFYPGLDSFYIPSGTGGGTSGSSLVSIENCFIQGFVAGIAISPNGKTQNAENIFIDNCNINVTKSAIAIGQDQNRSLSCRNLNVYAAKYAVDCTHYGPKPGTVVGTGNCPSIFNANIGPVQSIFSTYSSGSGASVDGMYCENTRSIGVLGGGGSQDGYAFHGCAFNLVALQSKPAPNYHLANLARATFNACQFSVTNIETVNGPVIPLWIHNYGTMTLNNCQLGAAADNALPFWINGGLERVTFNQASMAVQPLATVLSSSLPVDRIGNLFNYYVLPGCFLVSLKESSSISPLWVADGLRFVPLGNASTLNLTFHPSTGTATFNAPSGIVAVGDFIYSTQEYDQFIESYPATKSETVIGKVTSVDMAGVATVSYVPEFVLAAGLGSPAPDLLVAGFYKIHESMEGAAVKNSATVTITTTAPYEKAWVAGDRIRDDLGVIPPNTYVVSYSHPSLVLSQKATTSAPTIKLYDANVRLFTTTQVI